MSAARALRLMPLRAPDAAAIVWLLVVTLAAWRVTAMLCYEAGPWDAFTRLRGLAARLGMATVATCFHCLCVWVSAITVLSLYELDVRTLPLILAVAGGGSIIERALGGQAVGSD